MSKMHALVILIFGALFVSHVLSEDNVVTCFDCRDMEGSCNETHCYPIMMCSETCTNVGSCMLVREFNAFTGNIVMHAACLPQFGSFEYLHKGKPIQRNICKQQTDENDDGLSINITSVTCQCLGSKCNQLMHMIVKEKAEESINNSHILMVIGGIAGLILVVVILLLWRCLRSRQQHLQDEKAMLSQEYNHGPNRLSSDGSSLLDGVWDESGRNSCSTYKYSTSFSSIYTRNSKGNAMNHNNQHLPIELLEVVGRGQFAEVWKAKLPQQGSDAQILSVKVFRLHNYGAWRQEKEILAQSWMRHENIIEYYTSEQRNQHGRSRPQYWLITAFYKRGNLNTFLRNNTLCWNDFCNMALCITRGLSFLHSEHDEKGKPKLPIAHRDIKSCNILVKDDGRSCVLADLGLSLKLDPSLTRDELANAGQVGTSRYMAPELLERLVNLADIESFKRVDVYAMALVMWELVSRCEVTETMLPYQPPFGSQITDHPTKEQMLILVCRQKHRPQIPEEWRTHEGLSSFIESVEECWDGDPECRITASCFYERLLVLCNNPMVVNEAEIPTKDTLVNLPVDLKVEKEVSEITNLISATVV